MPPISIGWVIEVHLTIRFHYDPGLFLIKEKIDAKASEVLVHVYRIPRNLLRDFKILLKDAGLPQIRFHDLRHTAASLMLNNGVAVIVVSRRLGHAKTSTTVDIYGHLIPSMGAETAEKMDDLITPIPVDLR